MDGRKNAKCFQRNAKGYDVYPAGVFLRMVLISVLF